MKEFSRLRILCPSFDLSASLIRINIYQMKKGPHQRSKEFIANPQSSNQIDSRKKITQPLQNLNQSSPTRHFQHHPYSQIRAPEHTSGRCYHSKEIGSRFDLNKDISRYSQRRESQTESVGTENIVALQERLRNIHDHYKNLISEQKARNKQKNQVIMGLLQEMQATHSQKIQNIRKMIEESEEQKKEVGFVDDKMNQIKGNIDELIEESNLLKAKNEKLEKRIAEKTRTNEQKENQLEELNQELLEARTELEQFQLANIKNNRINRQIMEIFNSASTIASE